MANQVNDFWVQAALQSEFNNTGGTLKMVLLTSAYTYNPATHQFFSSVTVGARVATQSITSPAVVITTTGTVALDADDVVFATVPSGQTVTQAIIYKDTGTEATSRIVLHLDTITNFPITTTPGMSVTVTFSAGNNRIAALVQA